MAAHFFSDSQSLMAYVRANDTYVRHYDFSLGTITFIDSSSLHAAFDTRKDYEDWDFVGRPAQLSLF